MDEVLAVFPSTHLTLRGEKILLGAGVSLRTVMKPRRIASDCGLALLLPAGELTGARGALGEAGIPVRFYLRRGEGWEASDEGV